tara:strand:+ start:38 stop:379 length:342 start_codon:yes stop_codon:yes gene_type:complete
MRDSKNKYCNIFVKEREKESELFYRFGKEDEYWTIDHNVMRYFEEIEKIPEPTCIAEIDRLFEGFQYHSQYLQYKQQMTELIGKELKEYLYELFSILSRVDAKADANKGRRFS